MLGSLFKCKITHRQRQIQLVGKHDHVFTIVLEKVSVSLYQNQSFFPALLHNHFNLLLNTYSLRPKTLTTNKNDFNGLNIENRRVRSQPFSAALRCFSWIIGQVWLSPLMATLHFALKPSVLQKLSFVCVRFLYSKHHYTSGS